MPPRFTALLCLFIGFVSGASPLQARPNIILILADDLGGSDLACYGHPFIETQHLDKLASEGKRFTQAYAPAPICSASRASILTGKTPARLGFEFVTKDKPGGQTLDVPLRTPPFTMELPLEETTIAESLSAAGYETAFFGKWHLNRHHNRYLGWSPTHGPKAQGFQIAEEDFGSHPYSYKKREFVPVKEGEFHPDSMNERAIQFLHKPHEKPFFLMVSHFYVHTPIHTRARRIHDHYLEKIPLDHPRRKQLAHYAAMVTTLDHLVGELLAALKESGHAEETLVVFTSDNGGHPEFAGNAPLRGSKWNLYEGGIRVPFLMRWPGKIKADTVSDAPVTGTDLLPTFAEAAGAKLPVDLDGASILGEPKEDRPLIWHFPYYHPEKGFNKAPAKIGVNDGYTSQTRPHSVLRSGPWKLIHFYENKDADELYHLPTDPSESKNRVLLDPETALELRQKLTTILREQKARLPSFLRLSDRP